jgi:hypothetical protein
MRKLSNDNHNNNTNDCNNNNNYQPMAIHALSSRVQELETKLAVLSMLLSRQQQQHHPQPPSPPSHPHPQQQHQQQQHQRHPLHDADHQWFMEQSATYHHEQQQQPPPPPPPSTMQSWDRMTSHSTCFDYSPDYIREEISLKGDEDNDNHLNHHHHHPDWWPGLFFPTTTTTTTTTHDNARQEELWNNSRIDYDDNTENDHDHHHEDHDHDHHHHQSTPSSGSTTPSYPYQRTMVSHMESPYFDVHRKVCRGQQQLLLLSSRDVAELSLDQIAPLEMPPEIYNSSSSSNNKNNTNTNNDVNEKIDSSETTMNETLFSTNPIEEYHSAITPEQRSRSNKPIPSTLKAVSDFESCGSTIPMSTAAALGLPSPAARATTTTTTIKNGQEHVSTSHRRPPTHNAIRQQQHQQQPQQQPLAISTSEQQNVVITTASHDRRRNLSFKLLYDGDSGDDDNYNKFDRRNDVAHCGPALSSLNRADGAKWLEPLMKQLSQQQQQQQKQKQQQQQQHHQPEMLSNMNDEEYVNKYANRLRISPDNTRKVSQQQNQANNVLPHDLMMEQALSSNPVTSSHSKIEKVNNDGTKQHSIELEAQSMDTNSLHKLDANISDATTPVVTNQVKLNNSATENIHVESNSTNDHVKHKWLNYLNNFQESTPDVDVQMEQFIQVPMAVEGVINFGILICIDCCK